MVTEVMKDSFQEEVLSSELPVLVDFWGPSCQPCLALMPFVHDLAQKYDGKLKVVKVDSSKNRRLCIDLRVMSLPSFLLYDSGKEIGRLSGKDVSESVITRFLESAMSTECRRKGASNG
ncbi:MAG: thioredoxin family protein [Syntrophobacter sp.]